MKQFTRTQRSSDEKETGYFIQLFEIYKNLKIYISRFDELKKSGLKITSNISTGLASQSA